MSATMMTLTVDSSSMQTYLSTPTGADSGRRDLPGAIVIHARSGVDEFTRHVCDRLAEAGYVAAAPNLFHRLEAEKWSPSALKDQEVERDVRATFDYLRDRSGLACSRAGIVGFCMGGRVSYLMTARIPEIAASAVFYGGNIRQSKAGNPSPLEQSSGISCPMIGFFGQDDKNPSPEDAAAISAELTRLGKKHTFHSYPGSGHAFMNFLADSYRQHAAIDAWPKLLKFFDETLK